MSRYTIRGTVIGGEDVTGDLGDAMAQADEGACYTQQPIIILDAAGQEVARREWVGVVEGRDEEDDPIGFGQAGYYSDWREV